MVGVATLATSTKLGLASSIAIAAGGFELALAAPVAAAHGSSR